MTITEMHEREKTEFLGEFQSELDEQLERVNSLASMTDAEVYDRYINMLHVAMQKTQQKKG